VPSTSKVVREEEADGGGFELPWSIPAGWEVLDVEGEAVADVGAPRRFPDPPKAFIGFLGGGT